MTAYWVYLFAAFAFVCQPAMTYNTYILWAVRQGSDLDEVTERLPTCYISGRRNEHPRLSLRSDPRRPWLL